MRAMSGPTMNHGFSYRQLATNNTWKQEAQKLKIMAGQVNTAVFRYGIKGCLGPCDDVLDGFRPLSLPKALENLSAKRFFRSLGFMFYETDSFLQPFCSLTRNSETVMKAKIFCLKTCYITCSS